MNESSFLIKDIIKYLKDVYDGEKIEGLSQSFFTSKFFDFFNWLSTATNNTFLYICILTSHKKTPPNR